MAEALRKRRNRVFVHKTGTFAMRKGETMWFMQIRKLLRNGRFRAVCLAALVLAVNITAMACGNLGKTEGAVITEHIKEPAPDGSAAVQETAIPENNAHTADADAGTICVYVCGAVEREGVVFLTEGARVYEAIEAAGGLKGDAAAYSLNQAAVLSDADMLRIPTSEEAAAADAGHTSFPVQTFTPGGSRDGRINLNTAGKEELMTLSGIGEIKAQQIIAYREECGGFSRVEDLLGVSGIGEKSLEKLRDSVTVR